MKDLKLSKLSLKKDYVSELSSREMQNVRGGKAILSIGCSRSDSCLKAKLKNRCKGTNCSAYCQNESGGNTGFKGGAMLLRSF